ncbi:inositol 2-dehydrogenase [Shouchella shacheensis]|uniref:inositol 2-dehydrogenase n=1 Tax=Shouchella shacheensis TaxID=1649580 RepID=UPI00073FEBAC|nr:inositol 2-dehydrogenase [Shouchella shacheensis]
MDTVNVGIIGAGRIGKLHAENLNVIRQIKLVAISDLYADTIRPWANELGFKQVTTDYMEVLHNPEVDAVFVCSPTDTHPEIITAAAKAKKHVFCEKPVSFSIEDTQHVLKQVKDSGVTFQVGFNRRFDHNFKAVKDALLSDAIGELHSVKITSRDPAPPPISYVKSSGGLFVDMAIHDYDMLRYIVDSEAEEIYVQGACRIDPEIGECGDVDTAMSLITFKNGVIATVDNSRKAVYGYDQRLEVFGERGGMTTENDANSTLKISTVDGVSQEKPKYFFLERYKETYVDESLQFVHSIINNTEPPVTGYDGLQAELLAHAAKLSLTEKRPVKLSELLTSTQAQV